jgi:DNA-directed RNA polymerase subunit RPC12/RpoP
MEMKQFKCSKCEKTIEVPYGTPKPEVCPNCGAPSILIHRIDGGGRGMGAGRGRRCGCR